MFSLILPCLMALLEFGGGASKTLLKVVDYEPSFSPDGQRIAFISNRNGSLNLYTAKLDGKEIRRLTAGAWEDDTPAWSPDGKTIAFVSDRDGNAEIYALNVDGSGLRRLTNSAGADIHPAWSPDGRYILFNSSRNSRNAAEPETFEIFRMDAYGGQVTQLTKSGMRTYATYSPDGQRIVFRSSKDGASDLYSMDKDGKNVRQLTKSAEFDGWPSWSPDGRRIVFAVETADGRDAEIRVLELASGRTVRVSSRSGRCTSPKWSPNGKVIIFSRNIAGEVRLELVEVIDQ